MDKILIKQKKEQKMTKIKYKSMLTVFIGITAVLAIIAIGLITTGTINQNGNTMWMGTGLAIVAIIWNQTIRKEYKILKS